MTFTRPFLLVLLLITLVAPTIALKNNKHHARCAQWAHIMAVDHRAKQHFDVVKKTLPSSAVTYEMGTANGLALAQGTGPKAAFSLYNAGCQHLKLPSKE